MMGELVSLLHEGGYSLVLQKDGKIHTFSERGVADLYRLRSENPELLQGAFLADKVVGKGAAALMIQGGVAELHADVISEPALSLLAESPVRVSYGESTFDPQSGLYRFLSAGNLVQGCEDSSSVSAAD